MVSHVKKSSLMKKRDGKRGRFPGVFTAHPRRPKTPRKITSVFVSNLPMDVTTEELAVYFAKAGILFVDIVTGLPKVKLYYDEAGTFKGEALVIYLKEESVDLAIQLLHETELRPGLPLISVARAGFKPKPEEDALDGSNEAEYIPEINADDVAIELRKRQQIHKLQQYVDRPSCIILCRSCINTRFVFL